jgi:hypothetical protein
VDGKQPPKLVRIGILYTDFTQIGIYFRFERVILCVMAINKINNEIVANEILPLVWKSKPVIRKKIIRVDIIGDLTPEHRVYVIKSWGPYTPGTAAVYFAVSADCEDEAINKFIIFCRNTCRYDCFVDESRYQLYCHIKPSNKDRFTKFDEGYIETECFEIKEFCLQDFVVEYLKVM